MTPQEFVSAVGKAARQSMASTNIPASFVVADAALESGWGKSLLTVQGFNLFGVKADSSWKGATLTMQTREFLNGQWIMVPALWRKYPDWLASINDHAQFLLTNARYSGCFSHKDGIGFAQAVQSAGYATDPLYGEKIISIINQYKLSNLDD